MAILCNPVVLLNNTILEIQIEAERWQVPKRHQKPKTNDVEQIPHLE